MEGLVGNVDLVGEKSKFEAFSKLAIKNGHIACVAADDDKIVCYVNIINNFEGYLVVSEESSKYKNYEWTFIENNVEHKILRKKQSDK